MTNINCSENCIYEKGGKCTLNHINMTSKIIGNGTSCAYFSPRNTKSNTPPEKK